MENRNVGIIMMYVGIAIIALFNFPIAIGVILVTSGLRLRDEE